ncbi:hypothetical protein BH23BAC1_BH23BAC1_50290 [soil metagenome]
MIKVLGFVIPFHLLISFQILATHLLIPMDEEQKDHLKSYGMAYWVLQNHEEVDWLLNYRGGSFAFKHSQSFENELLVRGVSYKVISDAQYNVLLQQIANPEVNMEIIKLEKAPKIAVYTPKIQQPWDDAVTLVLAYAEIPYDMIYDQEVLADILPAYDWLHLHHEDFTGQYGKAGRRHRNQEWFISQKEESEGLARDYGYDKVSQMKLGVVKKIKAYVAGGGFMFAMCSAPETFEVALSANGVDIVDASYDGDGVDPKAQQKLDFSETFAFQNFKINLHPYDRGFSSIDPLRFERNLSERNDFFSLFTFSAKWDPIPAMLTQNHEKNIKGFMGQTTAFRSEYVKPGVTVMGETKIVNEVRYINGTMGNGTWTFYGGHDPEDYVHMPGEPPTDLALHPNSPGYRLILNNILFPAAKKKKQKT